jgi:pepF/M3 family oligoendopeptidase
LDHQNKKEKKMEESPPRWNVSNIYPGLESSEFESALQQLRDQIETLEKLFNDQVDKSGEQSIPELANLTGEIIDRLNSANELAFTLSAYILAFVSTDSHNSLARRRFSEFEQVDVRLIKLETRLTGWLGTLSPILDEIINESKTAQEHAFILRNTAEQSKYLMSQEEEALAADLSLSGPGGWNRLQGTLTSQLVIDFELDGELKKLPLPALINLHSHPDETVRKRAYEAELESLSTLSEPLAACLNGIKGHVNTLNARRGREDALHQAIDGARIDRPTLEAMLEAMKNSFSNFRRFYQKKASRLGKEKLPWWDIYAPVGASSKSYSFTEAREFILEHFAKFTPDLERFARRAFNEQWIDAEQREGKRGGAFCMWLPGVKESRVLSNFDGSLDQVSTIAHELGHAYHNHCAFEAGKTIYQMVTPMTLAETASIMCETIVMQAVLQEIEDPQEELAILDTMLIGDAQVIVDIYSRFLFEKEVFERRQKAELSTDEFCDIMESAQKVSYGDGLDERYLHKYMWTWKPHYYRSELSFYNFPYAFGLLFGTGLYAIFERRGADFIPEYKALLASTGEGMAADLAQKFGIDLRQNKFWEDSLAVIARRIDRYCEL